MTPIRARILAAIIDRRAAAGISPSLRELCASCGISSTSVARAHVLALAAAGHLRIVDGARGWVPSCERRVYDDPTAR